MTVLEAMDLLGLDDHPNIQADVELAMARAFKQTPRQRELLEEAARCLSADLKSRASRATSTQHHSTREILLFDENRDAVMFGDQAGPELPVAFQAPLVDDALWTSDDSVIFEGEAAMMPEFTVAPDIATVAAPEPSADVIAEPFDVPPRADTSISGEWHLMLESLEAEGLIKPEEGFSDALSAQPVAPHDTPSERLAVNPPALGLDSPIFAAPEPDGSAMPSQHAALLETPLFSTPLFPTPLLSPAQPEILAQPAFSLETPLFAAAPPTSAQAQVSTFDESLLISHGGSLTDDSPKPINPVPIGLATTKTLETLPSRKASEATQLSVKPAAAQPSEQPYKQVTGRAGIVPDATRPERRSARSAAAQPVTTRAYRDAREQPTQVRRRRQPVAVWLLSLAALLGSAVFIAPNLAAQLRDRLLPRAGAPTKPSAEPAARPQPQVRVIKPAAITPAIAPVRALSSSAKTVKPAAQSSEIKPKPSMIRPSVTKPVANKPVSSSQPTTPRVPAVVAPPASAVSAVTRGAAVVKPAAPVRKAPRVTAAISSASSLPPVARPEGFASSAVNKPISKPVVTIKPAVKPNPKPAPAPAPVASIEYQDKPLAAVAGALPGGLNRREFGRQFLNRKQFEVWQTQQLGVRFESFAQIPLETQVLEADAFREAVLIPPVRPTRPERP